MRVSVRSLVCGLCEKRIERQERCGEDRFWCENFDYQKKEAQKPTPVHKDCMKRYNDGMDLIDG